MKPLCPITPNILVYRTIFEPAFFTTEKPKLGVGPEPAVPNPSPQEVILSAEEKSHGPAFEKFLPLPGLLHRQAPFAGVAPRQHPVIVAACQFFHQLGIDFLAGIPSQDPIACSLVK